MKKKIRIISADFGKVTNSTRQLPNQVNNDFEYEYAFYNDSNFPSRIYSLHPRLKGKIPKMLDWLENEADYYIWMDSYYNITSDNLALLTTYVENHDICLSRHNQRKSISEEVNFISRELNKGNSYLKERYVGEPLNEQLQNYLKDETFKDKNLFSLGFFIYKKSLIENKNYNVMTDWFFHNSYWTIQDQISLPFLLHKHSVNFNVFDFDAIFGNPFAKYNR